MHGHESSDRSIVPKNPPNNAGQPAAEAGEAGGGRGAGQGQPARRTLPIGRRAGPGRPWALERIRQAARRDRRQRFTALLHHITDPERLRAAYSALKREAAPGVDGETWQHYGEDLEANLQDLAK